MSTSLLANLPKLRWYNGLLASNILLPYMIVYWVEEGLTYSEITIAICVIRSLAAALEIHAGHWADRWSYKACLVLGGFLGTVGSGIYATSPSLGWILFGSCFFGVAQSCCSGANAALARASSEEAGRPEAYDTYEERISGEISLAGALGALLSAGLVMAFGLTAPFWGQGAAFLMMFFIALTLTEARVHRVSTPPSTLKTTLLSLRKPHRRQLMAAIVFSAAAATILSSIDVLAPMYYEKVQDHNPNLETRWYGILWFGYLVAGWGFSFLRRHFVALFGTYGAMAAITVIGFGCYTLLAASDSPIGLLVILSLFLARPIQQAHMTVFTQKLTNTAESATIMSVRRFVFMATLVTITLLIGWIASRYGLSAALFINGLVGSVVAFWALKVLLRYRTHTPVIASQS